MREESEFESELKTYKEKKKKDQAAVQCIAQTKNCSGRIWINLSSIKCSNKLKMQDKSSLHVR